MAYTEELILTTTYISPYVRSFIEGKQGFLGANSYFGGKNDDNNFTLCGQNVTVPAGNEQDFLNVVSYIARQVSKETSRGKRRLLDQLIAEAVYWLKHGEFSEEQNARDYYRNVYERNIKSEFDYEAAASAYKRLESQGFLNQVLANSKIPGFAKAINFGEFAMVFNEIDYYDIQRQMDIVRITPSIMKEALQLREKIKPIYDRVVNGCNAVIKPNEDRIRSLSARMQELARIMKASDWEGAEYERAKEEYDSIIANNYELYYNLFTREKAESLMEEINKMLIFDPSKTPQGSQYGW